MNYAPYDWNREAPRVASDRAGLSSLELSAQKSQFVVVSVGLSGPYRCIIVCNRSQTQWICSKRIESLCGIIQKRDQYSYPTTIKPSRYEHLISLWSAML